MSCVIDLASHRSTPTSVTRLSHPAGVNLPFDFPSDADLLIPAVRGAINSGAYSADMIWPLTGALRQGDRALVIGAGIGVVSSLIAREGAERVIAIEANTALVPYLQRVHALNGVPWVENVNAVLGAGRTGRVPFFVQRDIRTSSVLPLDESWDHAIMVPLIDLNLILEEENISMIVCDIPATSVQLLAHAKLWSVERILVNCADSAAEYVNDAEAWSPLATQGFVAKRYGSSILFARSVVNRQGHPQRGISAFGTSKSA